MSISSIGIQTVTPSTGTGRQQQQAQQRSASNDNAPPPAKPSSQTTGQHVDKRV